MAFIYILLALVIILLIICMVFFLYTFYRKDNTQVGDVDSKANDFLGKFRPAVREGMNFINNLDHKTVWVKSYDNLKLVGNFYQNGNSKNTIILFHGYRSAGKRDFACAVKMYYDMGLNVLLVDQRAQGRSEGKLITFGIKERYDAISWANYVINNFGNDCKIILDGLSMGATTVMLAAGLQLPNNVKGVIADCGFTSPYDIIKEVAKRKFKINGYVILPMLDIFSRIFGGFSIKEASTVDSLKKATVPIAIIHGNDDYFVPVRMSVESYNAIKGERYILRVDGAGHGMSFLYDRKSVTEFVEGFIRKSLNRS